MDEYSMGTFQEIDNTTIDESFLSLFYRWFLFEYIFESESTNKEMYKDIVFKFFEAESEYADLNLLNHSLL